MSSYKNLLQEHFQKNKADVPEYNTFRTDQNKDNNPVWNSVMKIDGKTFNFEGKTKKEAEIGVAKIVYDYLTKNSLLEKKKDTTLVNRSQKVYQLNEIELDKFNKIILIDGENCDFSMDKLEEDTLVLIFAAKNTTKNIIFQHQVKYDNCYIFLSECVGKDAADHYLTFFAGKLSMMNLNSNFYVLTRDHYGEFIGKFLENCKFICSLDEI